MKDYDVNIQYHTSKANLVVDALSLKMVSLGSLACLRVSKQPLAREVQTLASLSMQFGIFERDEILSSMEVRSIFVY